MEKGEIAAMYGAKALARAHKSNRAAKAARTEGERVSAYSEKTSEIMDVIRWNGGDFRITDFQYADAGIFGFSIGRRRGLHFRLQALPQRGRVATYRAIISPDSKESSLRMWAARSLLYEPMTPKTSRESALGLLGAAFVTFRTEGNDPMKQLARRIFRLVYAEPEDVVSEEECGALLARHGCSASDYAEIVRASDISLNPALRSYVGPAYLKSAAARASLRRRAPVKRADAHAGQTA